MWKLKTIWSDLKKKCYVKIETPQGKIIAHKRYHKNTPYYLFKSTDQALGRLVVFIHGYTDNALLGLGTALDLAQKGFTSVLPETKWHGEEQPANFELLFSNDNFIYSIINVIKSGAASISDLATYLQLSNMALPGKAGIGGFSMGAYLSYLLPVLDKRFSVSAPVSGSPFHYNAKVEEHFNVNINSKTQQLLNLPEASQYITELKRVSWLIQHAEDDQTVSSEGSQKFCQLLGEEVFKSNSSKAVFYSTGGHNYYDYMRTALVNWFVKKL